MKIDTKRIWKFIGKVIDKWTDDKAPKLGAAISFYTVFSIAPLLIIAISVAGLVFGNDAVNGKISVQLQGVIGKEGADFVQTAIKNSADIKTGIIAGIASLITLFLGATAVFIELQDSLNIIWGVKPDSGIGKIKGFIKSRLISFVMVVSIGFLLLISLLLSTIISILNNYITEHFLSIPFIIIQLVNNFVSLFFIFMVFVLIYKILPDAHIAWKDTYIGSLITSILFVLGNFLISLYLGYSSYSSTYGAAGSLVIFLCWVYYSAQVLYLGAVFTRVYASEYGSGIKPASNARKIKENDLNDNLLKK